MTTTPIKVAFRKKISSPSTGLAHMRAYVNAHSEAATVINARGRAPGAARRFQTMTDRVAAMMAVKESTAE
jgi:hypothetical protein